MPCDKCVQPSVHPSSKPFDHLLRYDERTIQRLIWHGPNSAFNLPGTRTAQQATTTGREIRTEDKPGNSNVPIIKSTFHHHQHHVMLGTTLRDSFCIAILALHNPDSWSGRRVPESLSSLYPCKWIVARHITINVFATKLEFIDQRVARYMYPAIRRRPLLLAEQLFD